MRMTAANHGIDHFRQLLASDALMSRLEYVLLWPDFHLDLVRPWPWESQVPLFLSQG